MEIKSHRIYSTVILICILSIAFPIAALADDYPSPTSAFYINDFADVLSDSTERYIKSNAASLEELTSAQVVVVTINGIGDEVLEDYSLGLFRKWGIGSREKNNGVLILVDVAGRQSRIEVGYGLEGALPDGKTGRIQDRAMIPHFKEGDYDTGIIEGFNAIVNEIYHEYGYDEYRVGEGALTEDLADYGGEGEDFPPVLILIALAVIIPLIILDFKLTGGAITWSILRMLAARGGSGRGGGGGRRSGGGGSAGGGGSSRRW